MSQTPSHFKDDYTRLIINLGNIKYNLGLLRKKLSQGCKIYPSVKADGYGIGANFVVDALKNEAIIGGFFCAHLSEAISISQFCKLKSDKKIICFHQNKNHWDLYLKHNITPLINDIPGLISLQKFALKNKLKDFKYLLQFDSGFNRLGIKSSQLTELIAEIKLAKNCQLIAIISHLSNAANKTDIKNKQQLKVFNNIITSIKKIAPNIKTSICNSAGIFLAKKYHLDFVRPGIALYGGQPLINKKLALKPSFKIECDIIGLRDIKKNEGVGYDHTFIAKRNMKIATIALGYNDGILRNYQPHLKGYFRQKNQTYKLKLCGRISMDLICLDVSRIKNIKLYDTISFFENASDLRNLAKSINTIDYEILCNLGNRFKRIYIK